MANVKISGLPAATSVTAGTDVAPLVSGGITTKATPQQIVNAGLLAPGAIGSGTASTGAFTTLSASSTVSGTGFSTYLLSPPAIGTTAPAAGKFTDLTSTGNTTIGDASTDTFTVYPQTISLINSTAITAASTKTLTLNGGAGSNGLVLDASNNVGIGTTTSLLGKLNVVTGYAATDTTGRAVGFFSSSDTASAGSAPSGLYFQYTGAATLAARKIDIASITYGSGVAGIMSFNFGAMTLDSSGTLTVPNIYTNTTAAVTYVAVSSAGLLQRGGVSALKYKQDIRDLESIDINKFRPVRYKSKCENDDQTIDYFGFIADEVEEAGIKELIIYNDDGEPEGFQYERMTVVLLKAIQELSAELNELKAKVNVNV